MENLVQRNEKGTAITNSLLVAEKFGKQHYHVLNAIKNIIDSHQNSCQFFESTTYEDISGKNNPMYIMNRDGFTLKNITVEFCNKNIFTIFVMLTYFFSKCRRGLQNICRHFLCLNYNYNIRYYHTPASCCNWQPAFTECVSSGTGDNTFFNFKLLC